MVKVWEMYFFLTFIVDKMQRVFASAWVKDGERKMLQKGFFRKRERRQQQNEYIENSRTSSYYFISRVILLCMFVYNFVL